MTCSPGKLWWPSLPVCYCVSWQLLHVAKTQLTTGPAWCPTWSLQRGKHCQQLACSGTDTHRQGATLWLGVASFGYKGGTTLGKGHVPSALTAALGHFSLSFLLQGAGGWWRIKEGFLGKTAWDGNKMFVLAGPERHTQQTQAVCTVDIPQLI